MVITITNQKGGAGKTTTVSALMSGLQERGYSVLGIDMDPQADLTFSIEGREDVGGTLDLLTQKISAADLIQHTAAGDLIGSNSSLSEIDSLLHDKIGKEYRLREALEPIRGVYDFILVDTPPSLGNLTVNALTASDGLIIPTMADAFHLKGIGDLFGTIRVIQKYTNQQLKVLGILAVQYSPRAILRRDMLSILQDEISGKMKTKVYETTIRSGVAVEEAQATHTPLFKYAPGSNPAKDYDKFISEVLADIKLPERKED